MIEKLIISIILYFIFYHILRTIDDHNYKKALEKYREEHEKDEPDYSKTDFSELYSHNSDKQLK